jgi:hypothetical protein
MNKFSKNSTKIESEDSEEITHGYIPDIFISFMDDDSQKQL